jgi:hypothetical protein
MLVDTHRKFPETMGEKFLCGGHVFLVLPTVYIHRGKTVVIVAKGTSQLIEIIC